MTAPMQETPSGKLARQRRAVADITMGPEGNQEEALRTAITRATRDFWPEMPAQQAENLVREVLRSDAIIYSLARYRREETDAGRVLSEAYGVTEAAVLHLRTYDRDRLTEEGFPQTFVDEYNRRADGREGTL